jgi:hypothetical protein
MNLAFGPPREYRFGRNSVVRLSDCDYRGFRIQRTETKAEGNAKNTVVFTVVGPSVPNVLQREYRSLEKLNATIDAVLTARNGSQ